MTRRTWTMFSVCALTASALACSSANPASPVAPATSGPSAAADGTTLKVSAPGAVTPANNQKMTSSVIDLTASAAALQFQSATPVALQYRFQVFNEAGTLVEHALANGTTYRVSATLAPNALHTWKVRAEAGGAFGPFSPSASFITEDPALISNTLTDGTTRRGRPASEFIPGQRWQSRSGTDGINYDVAAGC